jgi:hypothetical protein
MSCMPALKDVASYVRSKNAGPFWVTIDIFCENGEAFDRLARAPALEAGAVGALYRVDPQTVQIYPDRNINVIKISFPRPVVAGGFRDRDAHAGQYFVPLLSVAVP